MRSALPAQRSFAGPWRLFVWTLAGRPRFLAGLALALIAVLGCELAIPGLLAGIVDAAVEARDVARVDRAAAAEDPDGFLARWYQGT